MLISQSLCHYLITFQTWRKSDKHCTTQTAPSLRFFLVIAIQLSKPPGGEQISDVISNLVQKPHWGCAFSSTVTKCYTHKCKLNKTQKQSIPQPHTKLCLRWNPFVSLWNLFCLEWGLSYSVCGKVSDVWLTVFFKEPCSPKDAITDWFVLSQGKLG